jgi:hypothetical protein
VLYQNDESRISVAVVVRLSVCPSPSIRRTQSHTQQTSEERERQIEGEGQKAEIDRDDATHRREERKRTKSRTISRYEELLEHSLTDGFNKNALFSDESVIGWRLV